MKASQNIERVGHFDRRGIEIAAIDHVRGIDMTGLEVAVTADLLPKDKERFIANREKRPSKRREDFQLVVRPFDCGQSIAKGNDLLSIMKGPPADKDVGYTSSLERADIGARNINTEVSEPTQEDSDVARPNRDGMTVLFYIPTAFMDQPRDERSDRLGKRFVDAPIDDSTEVAMGLGTGSATRVGRPTTSALDGSSGTYAAWPPSAPIAIAGAKARFTKDWIEGGDRKLVVRWSTTAPTLLRRSFTSS